MSKKILYSPGFGSGWSTWNAHSKEQYKLLCEYEPFIRLIEQNNGYFPMPRDYRGYMHEESLVEIPEVAELAKLWQEQYSCDLYFGGLKDLKIREIPDGEAYQINEYDGKESVTLRSEVDAEMWIE